MNKKYLFIFMGFGTICLAINGIVKSNFNPNYVNNTLTFVRSQNDSFTLPYIEENEMPILALINPPSTVTTNPSFTTKRNYEIYKEAGFNIVLPCYERPTFKESEVRKSLEICEELELAYVVNDADLRCSGSEGINNTIDNYKNLLQNAWYQDYESFAGIASKDEPNAKDFTEMAKGKEALQQVFPNKLFHSTLFPQYANYQQLQVLDCSTTFGWEGYEVYVSQYVNEVNPELLAYDYYLWHTIVNPKLTQDSTRDFFRSLSLFREYSLNLNIPYWVTINTFKHNEIVENQQYPLNELEWIVNMSIAYGATGIQYYNYWPTMEGYTENSLQNPPRNAMVTAAGTPTDTYYKIQSINKNVQLVDEYLLSASSKGIMQFGTYQNDLVDKDVLKSFGPLKKVSGGNSLIGCFENETSYIYYIVNNSINVGNSIFICDFNEKVNAKTINFKSGTKEYTNSYSLGFSLSAGDSILLEVTK